MLSQGPTGVGTGHRLGIQNAPAGGPLQITDHIYWVWEISLHTGNTVRVIVVWGEIPRYDVGRSSRASSNAQSMT